MLYTTYNDRKARRNAPILIYMTVTDLKISHNLEKTRYSASAHVCEHSRQQRHIQSACDVRVVCGTLRGVAGMELVMLGAGGGARDAPHHRAEFHAATQKPEARRSVVKYATLGPRRTLVPRCDTRTNDRHPPLITAIFGTF